MNVIDTSRPGHFTIRSLRGTPSGLPALEPGPAGAADAGEGAARKRKAPDSAPGAVGGTSAEATQRRRVDKPTRVRWPLITPPPTARAGGPDATPAYVRVRPRGTLAATAPLPAAYGDGLPPAFSPVPFLLGHGPDLDLEMQPGSPEHQRALSSGASPRSMSSSTPASAPRPLRPSSRQSQASPKPPQPTPPRRTPLPRPARFRHPVPVGRMPALTEAEADAGPEAARTALDVRIAPGDYLRGQFRGALRERAEALMAKAVDRRYGGKTEAESLRALDELLMAHRRVLPRGSEAEEARRIDLLSELVGRHVGARELETFVTSGRVWDLVRTVPNSLLTYGLGFMAAGMAAPALQAHLLAGEPLQPGPCLEEAPMPPWVAATLAHLVGDLIIGVGGEVASAIWRESRLTRSYNAPLGNCFGNRTRFFDETGAGTLVQGLSALPFAGAYIAHRLLPESMGSAAWRPAWGAAAAVTSGLGREGLRQSLSWRTNPTWLGGSAPVSQVPTAFELGEALRSLRSWSTALSEGAQDWTRGLRRALGVPGAKALVNVLGRTFAALIARGGSLAAVAADQQDDPAWKAAADAWLGLSWGLLSTLPARLTQALGVALNPRAAGARRDWPTEPARTAAPAAAGATLAITPGPASVQALTPAAVQVLTPGGR